MHNRNNGFDCLVEFWFQCAETMVQFFTAGVELLANLITKI